MGQTTKLTRSQSGYHAENLKGSHESGRVQLYSTVVVEWDAERITLRTGGYRTNTTKTRINQAASHYRLPFAVWQKKGLWFVDFRGNMVGRAAPVYNGEWDTDFAVYYAATVKHEFKGSEITFNRLTGELIEEV